jgi:outer membrane lipoprotein SlyB
MITKGLAMDNSMSTSNSRISRFATTLVTASALAAAFIGGAQAAQPPMVVAQAPCTNCGVVLSVMPVTRGERPKGIAGTPVTPGMAVGGVVGGLVGNQVGGGSGRTAATVLGAAGGAYAGHAIEKNRAQQHTAYVMRIRMQDGSTRTIEQRVALKKGARVVVEGKTARLARGAPAQG